MCVCVCVRERERERERESDDGRTPHGRRTHSVPRAQCPSAPGPRSAMVQIHFSIVMIRWTGLAPWEFEFPFQGILTSTFHLSITSRASPQIPYFFSSSLLLSSLELSDTKVYEPYIRALLGTAAHICKVVDLKLRTVHIPHDHPLASKASDGPTGVPRS